MATVTIDECAAAIRERRGAETRRAFAARVGCTERTLWEWETGRKRPRPHYMRKLVQMGVPADKLLA